MSVLASPETSGSPPTPNRGSGTLSHLTHLNLYSNQIGDAGLTSFATALGKEALPSLPNLNLNGNKIGNAGMVSLAGAIGPCPLSSIFTSTTTRLGTRAGLRCRSGQRILDLILTTNLTIGDTGVSALATKVFPWMPS